MIRMQVMGNVGSDATVQQINGRYAINFSVAHSEKFKDRAGVQQERTTWVNCTMWRENASVAQWIKKGTRVWIEGFPSVHAYQKAGSGQPGASLDCRVVTLEFAGSPPAHQQAAPTPQGQTEAPRVEYQPAGDPPFIGGEFADDLPF